MTILLVSHDLNLAAEVCDRLLVLAGGRAAATGAPEAVLDEALLGSVFGCGVVVDKSETTRRPVVRLTWRVDPPYSGGADRDARAGGREVRETR
jgi:iron complex transport system ATP-binding protein